MRISDWSSDVCSSDLGRHVRVHDGGVDGGAGGVEGDHAQRAPSGRDPERTARPRRLPTHGSGWRSGRLMRLGALIGGDDSASVTGFAIDHRTVAPGTVFGAFRGTRFNGEDFVSAAVEAGAVAVVARPEVPVENGRAPCG